MRNATAQHPHLARAQPAHPPTLPLSTDCRPHCGHRQVPQHSPRLGCVQSSRSGGGHLRLPPVRVRVAGVSPSARLSPPLGRLDALQSLRRPIVYSERERDYEVLVREAHEAASRAVLHVLLNDYQLLGRLQSVKRYFLMEQGDVVVHFLDAASGEVSRCRRRCLESCHRARLCCAAPCCATGTAPAGRSPLQCTLLRRAWPCVLTLPRFLPAGELQKAANEANMPRLGALLELAQRTSSAHVDVFKDDLKCVMLPYTLAVELFRIMNVTETRPVRLGGNSGEGGGTVVTKVSGAKECARVDRRCGPRTSTVGFPLRLFEQDAFVAPEDLAFEGFTEADLAGIGNITGMSGFCLDYDVDWPVSLVLNRRVRRCSNARALSSAPFFLKRRLAFPGRVVDSVIAQPQTASLLSFSNRPSRGISCCFAAFFR